jgi:hypothetical protein
MEFTTEAVLSLSPDDASTKAARGLTSAGKWPTLGANDQAVWGECQGSGSKPYQTQVDLSGPAFRCSCPSRKFPCKHGLALLLIRSNEPTLFQATPTPAWVTEWLASRVEKQEKAEQKAVEKASAPPPSAEQVEKRESRRWQTMQTGLDQLQLWMADHIERGIATLSQEQREGFQTMAARLVDAQTPGLSQRLKDAGEAVGSAPNWPERVLRTFGTLQLVADAVARRETLPEPVQADLKTTLGWAMDKAEVLASGEFLDDDFTVLAAASQPREGKVTERRVWLQGQRSGRRALLLDFSHGAAGFEGLWVVGHAYAMSLRYYPSASPLRAIVAEQRSALADQLPTTRATPDEWLTLAQRYAANPWLPLVPLLLEQAAPVYQNDTWCLHTGHSTVPMRLSDEPGWLLAAHSGGQPVSLFGEWDGEKLTPLTAWGGEGLWLNAGLT